jgi:hypothetical protein
MSGRTKWYEYDRVMLRLSEALPEVLFVLWGEGEEPEDLRKCYYLGRWTREAPARIEYPPFDPKELTTLRQVKGPSRGRREQQHCAGTGRNTELFGVDSREHYRYPR